MYYVDSQRTLLRRDSSLIRPKTEVGKGVVSAPFRESTAVPSNRLRGGVQKELVTVMFEAMLSHIVESWDPIVPSKVDDSYVTQTTELPTVGSTNTLASVKKKNAKSITSKNSKIKGSRSKFAEENSAQESQSWWSGSDEKVKIRFRNGNLYEGSISMKCMNGEGRFQWADGTVYLGHFKDNELTGKGTIQWKDDTWYQGEFSGNLRHGQGLYVDSRLQRSYSGGWYRGTKHGQGVINYSPTFKNSYDGQWIQNERFGHGIREYCATSGYNGHWERNIREGKGLMIWPNNDSYHGEWKNGVMSGYGIYIWETCFNNTMSAPSLQTYRGSWEKGTRNGSGFLNFGSCYGSFYKGDFQNNKKHGEGLLVTNDGFIIKDKHLFIDNNIGPCNDDNKINECRSHKVSVSYNNKMRSSIEPYNNNFCDSYVGLANHITIALHNIDRRQETIANIVNEYILNNKSPDKIQNISLHPKDNKTNLVQKPERKEKKYETDQSLFQEFFTFEETALHNAVTCYISHLKNIYYKYSTLCNTETVHFTPVLIRLYLWQLYYDCKIHEKGLTLYDIDDTFYQNREWLANRPHDPFEKIYFWQFLNSLLSVASTLYAKKQMPGPRPDTIVASSFRTFMERDLLPNSGRHKNHLVKGYGLYIPLKATYDLYLSLGEPQTIRRFIRAARHPSHFLNRPQPPIIIPPEKSIPCGRNAYVFGDEMNFILNSDCEVDSILNPDQIETQHLKLFNLGYISTSTIIKIFAKMFPQIIKRRKIMDLEIKFTFFEFFEAFVDCVQESIKIKDEETKFTAGEQNFAPQSLPIE